MTKVYLNTLHMMLNGLDVRFGRRSIQIFHKGQSQHHYYKNDQGVWMRDGVVAEAR